jgi:tRNA G18 (ribose-2'-O)-methylase SpoU
VKVSVRNAGFQQWQALLTNRTKRQRAGEFLVHGVRPITLALEHGWPIRTLIYPDRRALSGWARGILDRAGATPVAMAPELVAELGEKHDEPPELIAVVALPDDALDRVPVGPRLLAVVFDRPATPGNIGTLIRSADAFGTGSLFAVPVIRAGSHREVLDWASGLRAGGLPVRLVATDEHGAADVAEYDLTGPRILLIGNETHGLSAAWRAAADDTVRIPITGAASSLNAAAAATVVLYEAVRQRRGR